MNYGGENIVVEIDECKIGKKKYPKGRLTTGQWISDDIERNINRIFIEPIENRLANILLNYHKKWINNYVKLLENI